MILVTASDELKIARFVARTGSADREMLEAEARRRLARMIPDEIKAPRCDFVISNEGTTDELRRRVLLVWERLATATAP
jgi:dephospho-CoA kinase